VIEHPPSVVLVVRDGDDVVLVRQHRPAAGLKVVELPAGAIEPGESIHQAADRELAEECGLAVDEWTELGGFWVAPEYSTEFVRVLAGTLSGTAAADADEDEDIEVLRLPPDRALAALEDAGSVAALGLWMRHYG
jgi:8-oxo-dGTP pyrophosphatase MutT (NUDIX family)